MKIGQRFKYVGGNFETDDGKLVCVHSTKHQEVDLCIRGNMNIPFAAIKLFSSNLLVDAKAVFDDACALGDEIVRRWNRGPVVDVESDLVAASREAVAAIDALIKDRPMLAAKMTGSTTLGNIRAELKSALEKARSDAK